MSLGLRRFQQSRNLHFITFSCYHRHALLSEPATRHVVQLELESARSRFKASLYGYVVMPEHVHLILNEPEGGILAKMIQVLKQQTARRIGFVGPHFWQRRYYDFNIRSESKLAEKLRYTHRNPVTRGLVDNPEEWAWSSFRHYALGEEGVVKIESKWVERWGVRTPTRQDEYC